MRSTTAMACAIAAVSAGCAALVGADFEDKTLAGGRSASSSGTVATSSSTSSGGGHGGGGGMASSSSSSSSASSSSSGSPPSCLGGGPGAEMDCGASNDADCCASPLVIGGSFMMGRSAAGTDADANGGADEQPEHPVTVASFKLDRFEVTVGRFRKFVDAGTSTQASPPAAGAGKDSNLMPADTGWQAAWTKSLEMSVASLKTALLCDATYATWTEPAAGHENLPINCVTWFEAEAFCAWDGGWLPTEAEWEYAAAGGSDNRYYPWGSQPPTVDLAVFGCEHGGTPGSCAFDDIAPVGSAPAGDAKWGQSDLAGSMYEWNLDWYSGSWYADGCDLGSNCANLTAASGRVIRGGVFDDTAYDLRAADRYGVTPPARYDGLGFRCARTP